MERMKAMSEKKEFGAIVRAKRMELDLTQQELAERSGITQAHISRIESGEYNSSVVTVCRLAKALHIPVESLLQSATDGERKCS